MANGPRGSEGVSVVRFERTDFPQQGWIGKPNLTLYEARTGYGWYAETQTFRAPSRSSARPSLRVFYTDFPQQGWIGKPNLTLYEARTGYGWYAETQVTNPRLGRLYQRDANQSMGWIGTVAAAFDPAAQDWHQDTVQTKSGPVTRRDTNHDLGWLTANVPVAGYDPSLQDWFQDTVQTKSGAYYRRDTNHDLGWLPANVPVGFNPATMDWTQDTIWTRGRIAGWRDTNPSQGWLPSSIPTEAWTVPSDRQGARLGRYCDTNQDTSWIYPTLPAPFNAALFAGIGQLVGDRTPAKNRLQAAWLHDLYDYAWLHDVIPLTDAPPGVTQPHLRPIAPIMAARRRNRRR